MANPRHINIDEQCKLLSCTTPILADGCVTSTKLASGAVVSSISPFSITADKIALSALGNGLSYNVFTNAIDLNADLSELQFVSGQLGIKPGGVNTSKLNIDSDLTFNNHQALSFRLENVLIDPAPGNPGRLVWNTTDSQVKIDTGISFTTISGSGHTIEDEGIPLTNRSILDFVGDGVTVTDTGTKTQVSIPQGGHVIEDHGTPLTQRPALNFVGSGVIAQDFGVESRIVISGTNAIYLQEQFVVSNPAVHTFSLSQVPIANAETVIWNGLVLTKGASNDYTIFTNVITLVSGIELTIGDKLTIIYAY